MNRLTKVSQDRWNEIFEAGANYDGEQTFIDFDRKIPIGKNPSLIEHLSTIAYYDKSFVANLKANTPFMNFAPKSLPKSASGAMAMYSYVGVSPI